MIMAFECSGLYQVVGICRWFCV